MSDGMTEAYRGTYFKSQNNQNQKKNNKHAIPKGKWLNLNHPNKTFKNKKKSFKKRIKVIKRY
ncbi:hypothetical protein KEC49_02190 ['Elaeagnus angustifolia' witches'-broom phytoplasma]|uniref:Uncharacterized protein n=1 Tax='Elaeagnus angustifolia' witches'-broom phytoplasma TaxID=1538355 RepID=A0ABS5VBK8_9MOLU|nr:hypothetical protein ['Elaeagnus angustifolia' witches'-broom phytoplasma]